MRKSKTTNEPGEPVDPALELQPTGGDLARGNTIILNPALHSAAANLTGAPSSASSDGRSGATSVLFRKRTASKKPPALVLTKDGGGGQSSSTLPPGSGNGQALPHGSSSIGYGYSGGNCGSQSTSPGWKVTFPDIGWDSVKNNFLNYLRFFFLKRNWCKKNWAILENFNSLMMKFTVNPNWHELWKQEKCWSLEPPRGIFYKTQRGHWV